MILRQALPLFASIAYLALPSPNYSQELDVLKDSTEKWIQTRNRISKDRSDWIAEKEILQGSIDTLESTRDILSGNVEFLEMQGNRLAGEIVSAKSKLASFQATNSLVLTQVAKYETQILELAKKLPPPLLDEIRPLLRKIPTADTDSSPIPNRLQNVVAITTLIDEFNNDLTLSHSIKTLEDGNAIEVRILYWGLAGAYATNTDGTKSWIISPAEGEWAWNASAEHALAIKKLFDVYDKTIDPALVPIPFTFLSEGGEK